jgi:hypothetical protein
MEPQPNSKAESSRHGRSRHPDLIAAAVLVILLGVIPYAGSLVSQPLGSAGWRVAPHLREAVYVNGAVLSEQTAAELAAILRAHRECVHEQRRELLQHKRELQTETADLKRQAREAARGIVRDLRF